MQDCLYNIKDELLYCNAKEKDKKNKMSIIKWLRKTIELETF